MKKIILLSLGAAVALSSCNENNGTQPVPEGVVTFTSSIQGAATKVAGTSFEEGDAISVYANDGSSYVAENVKYQSVDGLFTSANPISLSGDDMSFLALYPYAENLPLSSQVTIAVNQSDAEAYEASDLLNAIVAPTDDKCPKLPFEHALSAVEINIISTKTLSSATINAQASVEYDLEDETFVGTGDAVAITPLMVAEKSFKAILAPQTIAAGSDFITLMVDGKPVVWKITEDITIASGYKYICNVTVTDNDVCFSGEVAPWTDGGKIDATINGDKIIEGYSLAEISAENIPAEDTWVITDTSAESGEDFFGLSAAIVALADSGREISLEFPLIEAFPNYAIFGKNSSNAAIASGALVSISAPEATAIGNYSFAYSDSLRTVSFPKVAKIGASALYYCGKLSSMDFPMLKEMGINAFDKCKSLVEVELPSATALSKYAFNYCDNLVSIKAPEAKSVGFSCFSYCKKLENVELPKVEAFGEVGNASIFTQCLALRSIDLPSAKLLGKWTFNKCSALESVNIPEVTNIDVLAFSLCTALKSVDAPKVEIIGSSAFQSSGIESFTIPSTLKTLGNNPFSKCLSLTNIVVDNNANFKFDETSKVLMTGDATRTLSALCAVPDLEVVLPSSVTTIGIYTFNYCSNLLSITAPGLTTVEDGAFWYCSALKKLEVSTNKDVVLSSYAESALYGATLENIDLFIGSANSSKVTGNSIDLGSETLAFKSITLVEAK